MNFRNLMMTLWGTADRVQDCGFTVSPSPRLARFAVALLALSLAGAGAAETISSSDGVWQPFPGTLNEDGSPYWDNPSMDGVNKGVGYFISGYDGAFPGQALNLQPDFLAQPGGAAPTDFYFVNSGSVVLSLMMLEISNFSSLNEFGWYDLANPGVLNPIFTGAAQAGDSASFSPSAQYGLYLLSAGGALYRTQSSLNPGIHQNSQQFAVFRSGSQYIVGAEDLPYWQRGIEKTGDFNDLVMSLQARDLNEVPEPSSFALIGGGLIVGASLLRRRVSRQRINQ